MTNSSGEGIENTAVGLWGCGVVGLWVGVGVGVGVALGARGVVFASRLISKELSRGRAPPSPL